MAHNSPLTDEYDCSTNVVFLAAMLTRFPYHIEFEKELLYIKYALETSLNLGKDPK